MNLLKVPSYNEELKKEREKLKQILPSDSLDVFDSDAQLLAKKFTNILKLKKGDKAPNFSLTNAIGTNVTLSEKLKEGHVILVFYRGSWCPYCNLILSQYQSILSSIKSLGGQLIAISPQTPDESLSIQEKNSLSFEVLSDNGNLVSRMYTTVFKNAEKPLLEMAKLGINFNSFYSDDSNEIPIPAVFIIHKNGTISFAKSEGGDYRNRTEAATIIDELKEIA